MGPRKKSNLDAKSKAAKKKRKQRQMRAFMDESQESLIDQAERNDNKANFGLELSKGKLSAFWIEPRKHFFYASTRWMPALAFVESLWYFFNMVAYGAAISGLLWDIHMRITQSTSKHTETALAFTGLILNYFALLSVGGLFVSAYKRGQYNCLVVVYLTKNLLNIAYDVYVILSCSLVGAELTGTTGTCTDGNYWYLHVTFGILLCLLHGYFSYVAYLFYQDNAKMTAFVSEVYHLYAIRHDEKKKEKHHGRHGTAKEKKHHGHKANKHGNEKK